jgi:hypothetical protein
VEAPGASRVGTDDIGFLPSTLANSRSEGQFLGNLDDGRGRLLMVCHDPIVVRRSR